MNTRANAAAASARCDSSTASTTAPPAKARPSAARRMAANAPTSVERTRAPSSRSSTPISARRLCARPAKPPSRARSGRMTRPGLAAADQQADEQPHAGGDARGRPRVVAHLRVDIQAGVLDALARDAQRLFGAGADLFDALATLRRRRLQELLGVEHD